ncbi:MAG TPA: hypothetical protein VEI97_05175 [bacterium]|nr:hypothetical protein [bacterium]
MNNNELLAALERALSERNEAYAQAWRAYRLSTGDTDPVAAWSALWRAMGEADKHFDEAREEILDQHAQDPGHEAEGATAHEAYSGGYGEATGFSAEQAMLEGIG